MIFFRFKALLVAAFTLSAACLTAPSPGNASPVSTGWRPATEATTGATADLFTQARGRGHGGWHRGRGWHGGRAWGHSRGLKRGHYKRGYYRGGYYAPRAYGPRWGYRAFPF
jgi:hypothetical protein